jgi:hypothetical protein
MVSVFEDIQVEVESFFNGLNWTFIMIFVFVLYGIKHKEEFEWYNKILDKSNFKSFKVWIAGFIIALFFCLFKNLEEQLTLSDASAYISTLLRSWIVVIVFNSIFSDRISKIDKNMQ